MTFLVSLTLTLLFAWFLNLLVKPDNFLGLALRLFLLAWANLVVTTQALSLLHAISALPFLLSQGVLLLAALAAWRLGGAPDPRLPLQSIQVHLPPLRSYPILYGLACFIAAVCLINAFIVVLVPQNNFDSLTYHLARVGYWLQHRTLAVWDTPNFRQADFPPNAEIGVLWSVLLWGSDRLSGFAQWLSALACMAAVAGLARKIGASQAQSLFAALVWASLPQNMLQATTTQNDLVVTAFSLSSVYFFLCGLDSQRRSDWLFSAVAVGLAVGTKLTFFFAIPGLGLAGLMGLAPAKQKWSGFGIWVGGCAAAVLLLGSLVYFQNIAAYRNPLGESSETGAGPRTSIVKTTLQNALIYAYQMADFSGLPAPLAQAGVQLKTALGKRVFGRLGWSGDSIGVYSIPQILALPAHTHEDVSWFGPLSLLAVLPALLWQIVPAVKNRDPRRLTLYLILASFFVTISLLIGWTPFKSRYFILFFGLALPFCAFLYAPKRPVYGTLVSLLAVLIAGYTLAANQAKPLLGAGGVWGKDAVALRTVNSPAAEAVYRFAQGTFPPGARIALQTGPNGLDYLFFGDHLQNTLLQVDGAMLAENYAALASERADYLIVGPRQQSFLDPPNGLQPIFRANEYAVYRVDRTVIAQPQPAASHLFAENDPDRLIFVDTALRHSLGVMETWTGSWPIESYQGQGMYWFGQGQTEGLGMSVWAEQELDILVSLQVEPGPSRADPQRTLAFVTFDQQQNPDTRLLGFNAPTTLQVKARLHRGVNQIGMYVLEPATIFVQPNGDQRSLLVLLRKMTVQPGG